MTPITRLWIAILFTITSACVFTYAIAQPERSIPVAEVYIGFMIGCRFLLSLPKRRKGRSNDRR
jgi:uncharacterized membrane protein AbrB (regulator of aidB expression)